MMGTNSMVQSKNVFLCPGNSFPFDAGGKLIYAGDCKWAIGGFSLMLHTTFANKANFINSLVGGKVSDYRPTSQIERAFIGASVDNSVYLCVAQGCDFYDEHLILKALGCTIGLALDGGGSTTIVGDSGCEYGDGRNLTTFLKVN